jgi:aromatic-L-amino-acid/L-tryptophan decarboxylase
MAGEGNNDDMTPEEFRDAGHALIDWIADYRETMASRPVLPKVRPGEIRDALPGEPPTGTDTIAELLADLDALVVPGLTMVQHPNHFGWFPSNAALASVLGDLASSGLGALGITWQSAPALTEVEEVVCDWMRQLVGLPEAWHGTIHDTASTATLAALLCARERASSLSLDRGGLQSFDRPLVVYASDQAHSSITKAALLAGFGRANLRLIRADPSTFALRADDLRAAIAEDRAAGRVPAAVVACVGTTATTAVDPVADIVAVAREHDMWVHVDAAMAGTAMLLPECRILWAGAESADSIVWNPHKWMGTILDTSLFYVRDPQHLVRVMSTNPSYLRQTVDGTATEFKDWGIPLGRRFRALKLWFHLRLDGIDAIRTRIRRDLDNAQWLAAQIAATPGWSVVAPVQLQTVCVVHDPVSATAPDGDSHLENRHALDAHTLAWVDRLNLSGEAFVTPAVVGGRWIVRVSIGVEATERTHVAALWELMQWTVAAV